MMNLHITAVVVTYNRKQLLHECLSAILQQTVKPDCVLVINNASTDGTEELFQEGSDFGRDDIILVNMPNNTGGAGGFYEGMRIASNHKTDWLWVMDDDTIPTSTCLEYLLAASETAGNETNASFFASAVYGPNGEYMNVPEVDLNPADNGYPSFYEYLGEGMIKIASATFVSLLIRKAAIERCGLPCKDYFIWGDDTEYTLRLNRYYGPAYMVGKSVAIHKRKDPSSLAVEKMNDPARIKMVHYLIRNNTINLLYYKKKRTALKTMLKTAIWAFTLIPQQYGIQKATAVLRGTIEGAASFAHYKKYIDSQVTAV